MECRPLGWSSGEKPRLYRYPDTKYTEGSNKPAASSEGRYEDNARRVGLLLEEFEELCIWEGHTLSRRLI